MRRLRFILTRTAIALCAGALVASLHPSTLNRTPRHPHDRPGDADRFFYEQRAYPDRSIPTDWYERAKEHVAAMRSAADAIPAIHKAAAQWQWVSMGPTNIAGRIRAMAMHPTDVNILYAGAAGGGVWKSTDGARTWRPLTDLAPNLRIGSIAVHPTTPDIVFAGNGEGFVIWQDALAYGRGILRSNDAGATWEPIAGTQNTGFEFVFDIAFDPFIPDIVHAATRAGLQRSTDGGVTWKQRSFSARRGMQSVFSRTTAGLVYMTVEGKGVYRSTDHGENWNGPLMNGIQLPSGFERVHMAAAPGNGDIIYAAFTAPDESCAGVFRSSDRGETWARVKTPASEIDGSDYMREQGSYNSVLAVSPANPQLVWAGGIDLYRSTDGGNSWKQVTNWYSMQGYQYVHADQHALLIPPSNPFLMYAGCDGGVYTSSNGGATFIDSNAGLITTQFHSGAPHPLSDIVLGGTIDNGNLKIGTGTSWSDVTGGDGGYVAIDPVTPRTMYAEIYYLDFYKSTNFGVAGSFRSKMNGIPRSPDGGTSDRCAFIAPFEMDWTDPARLYAGTYRLYRTTNGAELWTPVSPDLTGGSGYITAIGLAPSSNAVIYAGASSGVVQVSTDAGTTWTRVTTGLPNRYVTDIAVDPRDPSRAWLTVSGFNTGHVFLTTNGGANWTNASGVAPASLPNAPANTIVLHPLHSNRILVGTDVGVFESFDAGMTWEQRVDGLGNVTVADLRFRSDGVLFAATHGRGVFKSGVSLLDARTAPRPSAAALAAPYPNPASRASVISTELTIEAPSTVDVRVMDVTGRIVWNRNLGRLAPGRYAAYIPASGLPAGMYLLSGWVDGRMLPAHRFTIVR